MFCFYEVFGAYFMECDGVSGVNFCLWVFNVRCVFIVGDFNYWDGCCYLMCFYLKSGVWELFLLKVSFG